MTKPRSRDLLSFLVLLVFSVPGCSSGTEKRSSETRRTDNLAQLSHPVSSAPEVRGILFDGNEIALNSRVAFRQIVEKFGRNNGTPPTNHHSDTWKLCYQVHLGGDSVDITFESDMDMGGPEHEVLGFDLDRPKINPMRNCAVSSKHFATIQTDNGLYLGMSRDSLLRVMGQPSSTDQETLSFEFDHEVPRVRSSPRPAYDRHGKLVAQIDAAGNVKRLRAFYVETS